MKSRRTQVAAGSHTEPTRQHKSNLSPSSLGWDASSVSMKSRGDEPSPASPSATAEERELFRVEFKNAVRAGRRKSAAGDRSPSGANGVRDLWSRQAAAEECLVSVNEAARLLAVSVSTLYGWVWQRRISFVKLGRAVRFDTTDLREFVKENRVEGRGQASNV